MNEERMPHHNYRQCAAVWQRVAPELDPYPQREEERAEQVCTPAEDTATAVARLWREKKERQRQYLQCSRYAPGDKARRTLALLAEEEAAAVRRLGAVYFVLCGSRAAEETGETTPGKPWHQRMRQLYHRAEAAGREMKQLAGQLEQPALAQSMNRLAEEECRRARILLQLLEGYPLA
ncbi:MAG: hypothetical protein IJA51_04960 [Oscillospiraceae bacterium]|nr:hypothetical protein [Oscillospiraceae bacterium]